MRSLSEIAHALGGEVSGAQVLAPGPGHSRTDRSMAVRIDPHARDGFLAHSFAGDDWRACRDFVAARLGLDRNDWRRDRAIAPRRAQEGHRLAPAPAPTEDNRERAIALWRRRQPIAGTVAEAYLRRGRSYDGAIPPTFGFLPASAKHPAAMIAHFAVATEAGPGALAIRADDVRAVHLTQIAPNGERPGKITFGKGAAGSPIVVAPPNDLLGLAITEGIEDAFSVHCATRLGAWAAGSAGLMPALASTVPGYIEHVTIIADDNEAGRRGAGGLADALRCRGISYTLKTLRRDREAA